MSTSYKIITNLTLTHFNATTINNEMHHTSIVFIVTSTTLCLKGKVC